MHQFHTFQFSDESIFVFYVPAFWLLLKDLLQHHNAPAHQIYTCILDIINNCPCF